MNWYDQRNETIYLAWLESDKSRQARQEIGARWLIEHRQVGEIVREVAKRRGEQVKHYYSEGK